jgi:inner membrane transporter RhtA
MPLLAILISMLSIQFGAALAKSLFPAVGAPGATALRLIFAAALLLLVWRPWRHPLPAGRLRAVIPYGLALGAMNLTFYLALARIPLGLAVAVEFSGPLSVALLASRRPLDFLWAGLAATGIVLVLPWAPAAGGAIDVGGVFWALIAGACWASYIVFGQRIGRQAHGGTATTVGMLAATALVLPFGVAHAGVALLDPKLVPVALGVGLLSSALPYSLEMFALQRLPARVFGIWMSLEPAVAALSGWIMLGERLSLLQCLAIVCVMAASFGSALTSRVPEMPLAS